MIKLKKLQKSKAFDSYRLSMNEIKSVTRNNQEQPPPKQRMRRLQTKNQLEMKQAAAYQKVLD